jgi:hypothetical protein
MNVFPEAAIVEVPSSLAGDLVEAAERHPFAAPVDYYDVARQSRARDEVRAGSPDGFDWLIAQIVARLATPPFAALVRGVSYDASHRVFVAVCRSLGELISPPPSHHPRRAQLLHFIRPAEDLKAASGQALTEKLHTDAADWPEPADVIAMICVRPDPMGMGRSRLLDVVSLRRAIEAELGASAVELLEREAVPWQLADYLGGGVVRQPILTAENVRWRRYTMEFALRAGAQIAPAVTELLDPLERLIEGSATTLEFLLGAGDLLIMANRRCLHGRTSLGDASGRSVPSDRLMIRSWIRDAQPESPTR